MFRGSGTITVVLWCTRSLCVTFTFALDTHSMVWCDKSRCCDPTVMHLLTKVKVSSIPSVMNGDCNWRLVTDLTYTPKHLSALVNIFCQGTTSTEHINHPVTAYALEDVKRFTFQMVRKIPFHYGRIDDKSSCHSWQQQCDIFCYI